MIPAVIRNIDAIIENIERKRKILIMAGMIDAIPGVTSFRIRIQNKLHVFESSTAVIEKQPKLAEQQLIEFIDERKNENAEISCETE